MRRDFCTYHMIDNFDFFGKPVPAFNLKGKKTISTRLGGCLSIMIILLVLSMASLKLAHLAQKHNPNMTAYQIEHEGQP